MKVKDFIERLQKYDPEAEMFIFKRDMKRPKLGSGFVYPIKDIELFVNVDQDTNKRVVALEIKKDL